MNVLEGNVIVAFSFFIDSYNLFVGDIYNEDIVNFIDIFNKENADSIEGAIGKGKSALSSIKDGVIGGLSKFFSHDNKTDVNGDTAEEMKLNTVV